MDTFRLPSEYNPIIQPISTNLVLYQLEKVLGRAPNEEDRRLLEPCKCVEDFMSLISETYIGDIFLKGSSTGRGRLGEFYTALRLEKAISWEPMPGYDLWGAFKYEDLIKAGKVEVKTVTWAKGDSRHGWYPRISGTLDTFVADVVIVIGLTESLNPCHARLFVIPKKALVDTFTEQKDIKKIARPRISIARHEYHRQTGEKSQWYEYLLVNHTKLKERIGEHLFGQFAILTEAEQLMLPGFSVVA
jgi:hypothetical protein